MEIESRVLQPPHLAARSLRPAPWRSSLRSSGKARRGGMYREAEVEAEMEAEMEMESGITWATRLLACLLARSSPGGHGRSSGEAGGDA